MVSTSYVHSEEDWDDLLGTGTVLKRVLRAGKPQVQDEDEEFQAMEAPRKFFALINIETRCSGKLIESESHRNFLINSDADLFTGAHLVIPLMDIDEKSCYIFDPKFAYGDQGLGVEIPPHSKLECIIELVIRCHYDEFLCRLTKSERLRLAEYKRERGKFWYSRGDYQNAITIFKSILELCKCESEEAA